MGCKDSEKANIMNTFFANVGKELALPLDDWDGDLNEHIFRVTPTLSEITVD